MKKLLLSLSALLIFALSCNRPSSTAINVTGILKTGKWKISTATITMKLPSGKDSTLDFIQFIPKCHQDDYIKFDSLNHGAIYNNGVSCSVADPDSISFIWQLKNNNNNMDLYNGFFFIDSVAETILPYHIDTVSQSPILVLDTLADTPNVVLDTIWSLNFASVPTAVINIYNSAISNVTQSSFTMDFAFAAHYPDSTHNHQYFPNIYVDTFHYHLVYTNF